MSDERMAAIDDVVPLIIEAVYDNTRDGHLNYGAAVKRIRALLAEPEPPAISEAEIEAGANALWKIQGGNWPWADAPNVSRSVYRDHCRAVLDAARRAREGETTK